MTLEEYEARIEKYRVLLGQALTELAQAFDKAEQASYGIEVPLRFEPITLKTATIRLSNYGSLVIGTDEDHESISQHFNSNDWIAQRIIDKEAGRQPALILKYLRQIRAAIARCHKEAARRRKEAEKILRKQKRAIEALESELALLEMLEDKGRRNPPNGGP